MQAIVRRKKKTTVNENDYQNEKLMLKLLATYEYTIQLKLQSCPQIVLRIGVHRTVAGRIVGFPIAPTDNPLPECNESDPMFVATVPSTTITTTTTTCWPFDVSIGSTMYRHRPEVVPTVFVAT